MEEDKRALRVASFHFHCFRFFLLSLSVFCNFNQLPSVISRSKLAFMIMCAFFSVKFISTDSFSSCSPILAKPSRISSALSSKFCHFSRSVYRDSRKFLTLVSSKSSGAEEQLSAPDDEWLKKLPEKKNPLYSHSLPSIEAWLRRLGFYQSKEDRAVWFAEKVEWHAQLSLDVTDLYTRYLKNGPGNLEKGVERRFSYALSREDFENADSEDLDGYGGHPQP